MKAWMHIFAGSVGLLTTATALNADIVRPALVPAPVEKIFVPLGFDDNDDIEIVVHGHFINTCYKTGPISATVDHASNVVTIDAQAYHYQGGCAQVLVPFVQSVKIGMVNKGEFKIAIKGSPEVQTVPLVVAESHTSSPDDYLYAPVANVSLDEMGNDQYAITIKGEYPYTYVGCMVMREVRKYLSPGNTIVVQPIAALVEGPECEDQRETKKFSYTVPVSDLGPEEYLLHVRVLDGNSLNHFVDLAR